MISRQRREKYAQELREWQAHHNQEPERRARLERTLDSSLESIRALIGDLNAIRDDAGLFALCSTESPQIKARIAKNTEGMTEDQRRHFFESMDLLTAQIGLIGLAEKLMQAKENRPKFQNAPAKILPALIEDRLLAKLADVNHEERQRIIDEIFNDAEVQRVTEKTLRAHRKIWRPSKKR